MDLRMGFRGAIGSPCGIGVALGLLLSGGVAMAEPLQYTGVNLAGATFYTPRPGVTPVEGRDYAYPRKQEFEYFGARGMNIFRVLFFWELIQPEAKKDLSLPAVERLKAVVKTATDMGLTVILDPHNSARYYDKVVGGPEVGIDAFADFWGRLAEEFKGEKLVWFGLVNEPYGMPTGQWFEAANAAIAAIRRAGAENLILVPGNGYSGAMSWSSNYYGEPNAVWALKIVDPANNYLIEVHQYLDSDNSGSHSEVVSTTIGSERLKGFVAWCREHQRKAFLGEFAVAVGEDQQKAVEDMLTAMERDRDVWVGFAWWAAGRWWPPDYRFLLEPKDGQDRPQMAYLTPHLQKGR
jgi:endoglucanase